LSVQAGVVGAPRASGERADRDAYWERLLHRYRGGDHAAREMLVREMLPLANQLARRYAGKAAHEDLLQAGLFGLTKAIDRFDASQGSALSSYAVPTMLGEMRRYLRDHTWSVRVPRGLQEDVLRVNRAVGELETELGRSPTPLQVAERVGLDLDVVLEALMAGRAYRATSMEERVGGEADDLSLIDTLGAEDSELHRRELLVSLRQANHVLSERERFVLHLRFAEDRTQTEIADRIGVSQMQVSRILRVILDKLRLELRRQGADLAA
jgi:RNA polymerase sigma-B factor